MSELGIIGQMYEDRRTKKQGKIVQRDEKFKTLLMESPDGKSFNVSFGGFKSNWRKVDEPEVTLEEAMEEVPIPENPQPVKKSEKKKKQQMPRNVSKGLEETTFKMLDYVKSFNNADLSSKLTPNKRRITLKLNGRRIFLVSLLVRNNQFMICVDEPLFKLVMNNEYVKSGKYNDEWNSMKYSFLIDYDQLDRFLEDVRNFVIDFGSVKEDK